jgi:hypothetical protein
MRNGIIYRKSRYFTFNAAISRAGPKLAKSANAMKAGKKIMCQFGRNAYQTIRSIKIIKFVAKSMRATRAVAAGIIIRGKYTFEIKFALPTMLFEASERTLEKRNHGNIPAKTRMG